MSSNDAYGSNNVANSNGIANYCFELERDHLNVTKQSESGDNIKNATDCQDIMGHSNGISSRLTKFLNEEDEKNNDYSNDVVKTTQTKRKRLMDQRQILRIPTKGVVGTSLFTQ